MPDTGKHGSKAVTAYLSRVCIFENKASIPEYKVHILEYKVYILEYKVGWFPDAAHEVGQVGVRFVQQGALLGWMDMKPALAHGLRILPMDQRIAQYTHLTGLQGQKQNSLVRGFWCCAVTPAANRELHAVTEHLLPGH